MVAVAHVARILLLGIPTARLSGHQCCRKPLVCYCVTVLLLMSLTAGVGAANSVPRSPFQTAASTGPAVISTTAPASATIKSGSKGSKITACSLAIVGLQQLPGHAGTSKQIMTAVESDPMLANDLNW